MIWQVLVICYSIVFAQCVTTGQILLIRHGEKNAKAKFGDVHLNNRGYIRANALAELFFPSNEPNSLVFPNIVTVVAQSATDRYPSRRKIETAEPIAAAGKIPLKLFDHEDITGTCEFLLSEANQGRTTLVVWDHSTINDLANQLLQVPRGTVGWPMDRYDVVWLLDAKSSTLQQYCQHLLFGDLWCPVNPIQAFPVTDSFRRYMNGERGYAPVA